MALRIAGGALDAWMAAVPALRRARRGAARAWLSAPGDLLGRLVVAACGARLDGRRLDVPGVGEAILVEDPLLGRYLDAAPLRPHAQTLGRIVLARERLPDSIVRHELVHVRQWARFGPLYLFAYGLASLVALLAGL
ncbi:MAG TPA: hypothetical protein VIV06_03355, partial [Candidatus Limnocylindrales bacterium]